MEAKKIPGKSWEKGNVLERGLNDDMKKERRFVLAYLMLIIPILVKYFYSWLIQDKLDYFLLILICLSTVVFVVGSIIDKKGGDN